MLIQISLKDVIANKPFDRELNDEHKCLSFFPAENVILQLSVREFVLAI